MASMHPSDTGMAPDMLSESAAPGDRFAAARQMESDGDVADAIEEYGRLAEMYPEHAILWHRLAVAHNKLGNMEIATECYRRALQLDPNNPELLCDCGYAQFLQGNLSIAEGYSRRALQLNPAMQRARNNLGMILAKGGQNDAAVEQFRMAGLDSGQADRNLKLANQMMLPTPQMDMDRIGRATQVSLSEAAQPAAPPAIPPTDANANSALVAASNPQPEPIDTSVTGMVPDMQPMPADTALTSMEIGAATEAEKIAAPAELPPVIQPMLVDTAVTSTDIGAAGEAEKIAVPAELPPVMQPTPADTAHAPTEMVAAAEAEKIAVLAELPPPRVLPDVPVSKPQPLRPLPLPLAMVIANQTIDNLIPTSPAVETVSNEETAADRVSKLNYYGTDPSARQVSSGGDCLQMTSDASSSTRKVESGRAIARQNAAVIDGAVSLSIGDVDEPAPAQKASAETSLPGVVRRLGDIE
jgi:Tfp pilus assembly protein PilF